MKWRLLLAFTGLLTMVLVAQDVPLFNYLRDVETERLLASLERDAFVLAGASEDLLSNESDPGSATDLQQTIDDYSKRQGARVVITDRTGRVVVATDPTDLPGDDFSNRPEIASALTGVVVAGERVSNTAGEPLVYVAVPVLSGTDVEGAVREARYARRLGYRSKSLVRPDHARPLNLALTPDAAELQRARALVEAFEAARQRGEERALVDGLWVEVPTYRNALRLLDRARRLGAH